METIAEDFKYTLRVIGSNLRLVRTARKQSSHAVSNALDIPQSRLIDIEKGEYDMELALLIDLCHYYQVKAADVVSVDFKYTVE